MADLLQQLDAIAVVDLPIEEIYVLHEPNGIGRETETRAVIRTFPTPHMVPRIAQPARQHGGKLAHQKSPILRHDELKFLTTESQRTQRKNTEEKKISGNQKISFYFFSCLLCVLSLCSL